MSSNPLLDFPMSKSRSSSVAKSALTDLLADRIRRDGPLTFYEWMHDALYHKVHGYYMRAEAQVWGRKGDYRTSPERSELFAATFARYFAQLYYQLDRPERFQIFECGPGDGTFASGVLTALRANFPDVYAGTTYLVDDISDRRRPDIEQRVNQFAPKVKFASLASAETLSCGIVFSNELLDAFPVHRVTKRNGELAELYVTLNAVGNFDWISGPLSNETLREMCRQNGVEIREDQVIELSPDIDQFLNRVAETLIRGYVITVDYGGEALDLYDNPDRFKGALRAYSHHEFADVLSNPGEHDISTHVNWTRIRSLGNKLGLQSVTFDRQDKFLLDAGILDELQRRLATARDIADCAQLTAAAREMILPGGMASSFDVLVQKRITANIMS